MCLCVCVCAHMCICRFGARQVADKPLQEQRAAQSQQRHEVHSCNSHAEEALHQEAALQKNTAEARSSTDV